ncbi:MAG: mechanosensitive ion channel family protein [Phycisphaeraceae bacterium]|nr:mechanosensitive ion channel family protein [Phycisphaeraceae bacterium]
MRTRRKTMAWVMGALLACVVRSVLAEPTTRPAEPEGHVDRSSPQATMFTFLGAMRDMQGPMEKRATAWQVVRSCFPPEALPNPAQARQLKAIIDKLGEVREDDLPDKSAVRKENLWGHTFFPQPAKHQWVYDQLKAMGKWPEGEIALMRQTDNVWSFTPETMAQLAELTASMAPLPPRYASPSAVDERSHSAVVGLLGATFVHTSWWQWLSLLGTIFVAVVAGRMVQGSMKSASTRLNQRGWKARAGAISHAAGPLSLAILTLGLSIGLGMIVMDERLAGFFHEAIQFLYLVAAGWFLYNLVELIELALLSLTSRTSSRLDDMIVPLIRKTLRIFLVIVFIIVALQNVFNLDITGFLASLGIAGLAVSLAAQDSVKNLFGSVTIFFDKPFSVGDRIVFDGHDGTVEEIGFRSTRIRTLEGHLVTVPNMKFTDSSVENVAARPSIRRIMDITITYDTPAPKIERAVEIVRQLLCDDAEVAAAFDMTDLPPRVAFDNLNADSLNIKAIYWYTLKDGRDYWSYLAHCQQVNLKLFRAFAAEGIEFAFPTQTLYLAGDPNRQLTVNGMQPRGSGDGRAYT